MAKTINELKKEYKASNKTTKRSLYKLIIGVVDSLKVKTPDELNKVYEWIEKREDILTSKNIINVNANGVAVNQLAVERIIYKITGLDIEVINKAIWYCISTNKINKTNAVSQSKQSWFARTYLY